MFLETLLDGHRAFDRVDRAGKVGHEGIPHGLDDPALMLLDLLADEGVVEFQEEQGAGLVLAHHLAVAHDIREHDGGKPAFQFRLGHRSPQSYSLNLGHYISQKGES